jgi:3-hydroxyacyl-CoA dehydrogenase
MDLARFQTGSAARNLAAEEAQERCLFAMVNEAARALEDQVVSGPVELDLATVFGLGFAPFRGGVLRYADEFGVTRLAGRLRVLATSDELASRPGGRARFQPAPLIERLVAEKRAFHA